MKFWNVWRNGSKDEEATVLAATPRAAAEGWLRMGDGLTMAQFTINVQAEDDTSGVFHQFRVAGGRVFPVTP